MKDLEEHVAVDSTGLSTDRYARWVDDRTKEDKVRRKWVKVHIICGVRTNIVTSVMVTQGESSDSPQFKRLLAVTKRNFSPKEISADAGYISGENMRHALLAGAAPFIMFKSNNAIDADCKCTLWKNMLRLFKERYWVYMSHYNQRSNVETTFSMIKAKFGGRLRSVDSRAQINEALLKILCHNICVLIQSLYEFNIKISFPTATSVLIDQEQEYLDPRDTPIAGRRFAGILRSDTDKQAIFGTKEKNGKRDKENHSKDQILLFS